MINLRNIWRFPMLIAALVAGLSDCSGHDANGSVQPTSQPTDAPTSDPTATPTAVSPQDRAKAIEYWGKVTDIYAQAIGDAASAFGEDTDRSDDDNYLFNCSSMATNAKELADIDGAPDGWDDVKAALDDGLSDLLKRCTDAKTNLYSGVRSTVSRITRPPDSMKLAYKLAKKHLKDAGGDPKSIRLVGVN